MKSFSDIEKIYCINLKRREDRKKDCIELFNNLNIKNFEFVEAKDGQELFSHLNKKTAGRVACSLSHMSTISKIKNEGFKYSLILEDDFICENDMIDKFNVYCDQVPEDFCILYLGVNNKSRTIDYSKNVNKCTKGHCTHAYIVNSLYLDKILEGKYQDYIAIDVYYSDFIQQKYPCYCFNPKLIWQRKSYSDIENRTVIYRLN